MGDSAIHNLAIIALKKTPQEAKELFLDACKPNGKAVPMSWCHTDAVKKTIKNAEDDVIQKHGKTSVKTGSDTEVGSTTSTKSLLSRKKIATTSLSIKVISQVSTLLYDQE